MEKKMTEAAAPASPAASMGPAAPEEISLQAAELRQTGAEVTENAPMSRYTSFRAGGQAALLITAADTAQLRSVLKILSSGKIPSMILGNGTNVLFKDSGYRGAVIRLGEEFARADIEDENIRAGGACLLSAAAKAAWEASLAGMEFAAGIPGSVGGAVFMNAGAYGSEIKDILTEVRTVSADGGEERTFTADELDMSYRFSNLQNSGYIVTSAMFRLRRGDKSAIGERMSELAGKRTAKQPLNFPSAGSTFKRPRGYFAGKLIEDAGMKGVRIGGAEVSELHSGFIVNTGCASAADILDLIALVQNTVYDKFGVSLEPEVRIIG